MTHPGSGALLHELGRLFGRGTFVGLTEGELLRRFVVGRDESAFEMLVARHGPMVLGICRQLLQDPNDVDDAFQATFLVLVRKAAKLRRSDLLGNWLYGVAYRVAARARANSARRRARFAGDPRTVETLASDEQRPRSNLPLAPVDWDPDPWPGLHQEISHLPEKYRVPIVLCYFEGLTHDEAASRLGWPLGSVKGRLARARDLLRRRLSRRGADCSPGLIVSYLNSADIRLAVPSHLRVAASTAARSMLGHAATSIAVGSTVSIPVTALVEGVLQTIMINQLRSFGFSLLCAAGVVTTGVVLAASQLPDRSGDHQVATGAVTSSGAVADFAVAAGPGVDEQDRPAPKKSGDSASDQIEGQIRSRSAAFERLLSRARDLGLDDIVRLNRWSNLTMQADLVLAKTDADEAAIYRAHRDRIKALYDQVAALPVSPENQPIKANRAHDLLERAESLLTNRGAGGMGMSEMMGRQMEMQEGQMMRGGMRGMTGMTGMGMMRGGGMMAPAGIAGGFRGGVPQKKAAAINRLGAGIAPAHSPQEFGKNAPPPEAMGAGMAGGMMGGGAPGSAMAGGMAAGGVTGSPAASRKTALRRAVAASFAQMALTDPNPRNKPIYADLEKPISMPFSEETPLEDVVKYIKAATTTKTYSGIRIYVDPAGLAEADKTLTSTVRYMDLEGVPLRTTLRLLLKQLDLAYCVRDGVLIISSCNGILEELEQLRTTLEMEEEFGGDQEEPAAKEPAETPEKRDVPRPARPAAPKSP